MNIAGKTILLTGATGGIGEAIAAGLARTGARLILTGRNRAKLEQLKLQLSGSGHLAIVVDLASVEERARLKALAEQEQVDILINNAGLNQLSLHAGVTDREISRLIELNLSVPMMLCRDFIELLRTRPEAAIVNVGSILGSIGFAGSALYCATKFGLRGFTEALRRELADSAINVVYFAPRAAATAINSDNMVAMNAALGTAVDAPAIVAKSLLQVLQAKNPHNHYLGWPEKLFVRLNSVLPKLVDNALRKKLPTIQRFAQRQ